MKLLMISGDRSMLGERRGAFHYTLEEFSKRWDRVDVICPRTPSPPTRDVFFDNVFFHPSPWNLAGQSAWIIRKGKELMEAHGHDVMTVHEYPPFYNGLGARRLMALTGVPAMSEVHHLVGFPRPASLTEFAGRIMTRRFLPRLLASFDLVRVVNGEVRDQLVRWGVPAGRIALLPAIYLDHRDFASLPPHSEEYDVCFCARLEPNKGLKALIEAVAGMPGVRLLVVGDGSERAACERLAAARGCADRVRFVGWLSGKEDVYKAMRSAKVFVMNSSSEGGPRIALEALACGVPVVATRVGLMPDVLRNGENGLFTDGTPRDLRAKLGELLRDDGWRRQMRMTAADMLFDRFDRGVLIDAYANALKDLAKRHALPSFR
jgi:glycosyltransferase involved in cell wall biosynthesis